MGLTLDTLIPLASSLFCWVVGLVVFRRLPLPFQLLVIHAFISFAMDVWGIVLVKVFHFHNNQAFFNFYQPFDFLLMLFAARENFGRNFRKFSIISIGIFFLLWILSLSINGIDQFANQAMIVYGILLTIVYFVVLLRNVQEESSRYTTGIYCIAIPVVLYYCCTIPHFGLMRYFEQSAFRIAGNSINDVLNTLRYCSTGIGLILLSKRVTKPARHAYQ